MYIFLFCTKQASLQKVGDTWKPEKPCSVELPNKTKSGGRYVPRDRFIKGLLLRRTWTDTRKVDFDAAYGRGSWHCGSLPGRRLPTQAATCGAPDEWVSQVSERQPS